MDIAEAGHNNPPSPFEEIKQTIDDLYLEAKNFADGEPITTKGQAEAVSALIDGLRKAATKADDARKTENKPFDEGKAVVQEKYNRLIGKTKAVTGKAPLAIELCEEALKPWLLKLEAAQAERERIAAEQAAQAALEAQEALAKRTDSLEDAEKAEAAILHAKAAGASHKAATKTRANVKGGERAVGLTKTYTPVMTDGVEAARHYWKTDRTTVEAFFLGLAEKDVRAGKRAIPGFEINEGRKVR